MVHIGIICPSEIALRRFLPGLQKSSDFQFVGVAVASPDEWNGLTAEVLEKERQKASLFIAGYGGEVFEGYKAFISNANVDAVYLPLPPALHYKWAKLALESGKHVLVEKPFTTNLADTQKLVDIAKENRLALHENYMFVFHNQLQAIDEIVQSGVVGDVRLYRISFGFPKRTLTDFRYDKTLGGGALLDCGGYTLKYASKLLGRTAKVVCAQSNYTDEFSVDAYGSATLTNDSGVTAQVAFGMDNSYKCDLEVWGSNGTLITGRILTAPPDFASEVTIKRGNDFEIRTLPQDDAFMKSIQHFQYCIEDMSIRLKNYDSILRQAELVDQFTKLAGLE